MDLHVSWSHKTENDIFKGCSVCLLLAVVENNHSRNYKFFVSQLHHWRSGNAKNWKTLSASFKLRSILVDLAVRCFSVVFSEICVNRGQDPLERHPRGERPLQAYVQADNWPSTYNNVISHLCLMQGYLEFFKII